MNIDRFKDLVARDDIDKSENLAAKGETISTDPKIWRQGDIDKSEDLTAREYRQIRKSGGKRMKQYQQIQRSGGKKG